MTGSVLSGLGLLQELTIHGASTGPLVGTTFVAKDLFDVEGHVATCGNPDWGRTHEPATVTASAVTKLISAGSTLRGKTNMDELAYGMDGINIHYGTPLNPQFTDRLPGGSSSGSASAVASHFVDFALGSDTAGSVRVPASYCGIFGFRPTHGRIAMDGVSPLAPSLDTVGWFARSAAGLKKCGEVLLGDLSGEGDACESLLQPRPATILVAEDVFDAAGEDIKPALRKALQHLEERGYNSQPVKLGPLGADKFRAMFRSVQCFECWTAHGKWITETNPHFGDAVRDRFQFAKSVTRETFEKASQFRAQMMADFKDLVKDGNTILCFPTTMDLPPLLTATQEELDNNRIKTLNVSVIAPMVAMPQVSIPVELSATTSTGMAFLSAPNTDESLLRWTMDLALALNNVAE